MLPPDFHPVLQRWWQERFRDEAGAVLPPTDAQRDGWREIRSGRDTLIAAPTGSGKTLAAFLTAMDQLLREGLERGDVPDEVRVVYVSPLKALSADIHKNLAEPRREIRRIAAESGLPSVRITAAVRSGDTPQGERAAMLRMPPHILVTTPESLYLLLTAAKSRAMLRTARAVIVDEIHAVVESRRGAHLALSLERLDHACGRRLQRIGLSATQNPVEEVGRFLVGSGGEPCAIVDHGHRRRMDLEIEVPASPLEAVMSGEVWQEIYRRLIELVASHRTTLIMVNTRRLAERMAFNLSGELGAACVAAHHGSLSKDVRLDAEERLRSGRLKVMVATASLELGIDIGHVDLVCQISSPRRIATLLQRVGRSGHAVDGLPKGRLFPLTRDDLVTCAAMVRAAREGELDRIRVPDHPLDVLAQQLVAETAAEEWDEDALYAFARGAYPYRGLARGEFDDVVAMLANGYSTRRGRRGALVHHDAINRRLRGRRGSRMAAITSGGAIPEVFDYRVVLEPEGVFIGTLNEDFAIESLPGDIFQLGNTSWRILRVGGGVVRVADARGQPPSMPFWLGEAPSRSAEVSAAVSRLRATADALLPGPETPRAEGELGAAIDWLETGYGLPRAAAGQIAAYLGEGKRALGAVPAAGTLVLERFFDESGGMQLVLHAPFGSRVNRAWGLALRKKFCQGFNFELQAAATDEGIILSLGSQHSFPLPDVFRYLNPATVRETLTQAVLASPIFETRWRWTTTLALAVPRNRNGTRVPAQLQRMYAEDLLQCVFPDAAACLDNIHGAREIPDHPLVNQSLRDCLEEAMDLPGLIPLLERVHRGELRCLARETPEPSVFCHELLNSAVYTFLDDAPLEERRTQAVYTRRATEAREADDLGALDPAAIARVREEAWPAATTADELHDALLLAGFLRADELSVRPGQAPWAQWFEELNRAGRAFDAGGWWVAVERFEEFAAVRPQDAAPAIPARLRRAWTEEDAARELVRGRMEVLGPVTARELAASLELAGTALVDGALLALETEGRILRGRFTPGLDELQWCDRRLLARIHRYTLNRLRAEIEPVTAAEFTRFLLHWQHVAAEARVTGTEGLAAVVGQLDGFEVAAGAWERDVLPARVRDYAPGWLDALCLSGRVAWGRLTPMEGGRKAPLKSSPIALMPREHAALWRRDGERATAGLSSEARAVHAALVARGALFFHELVSATGILRTQVERALGELAGAGVVTADSYGGLRALLTHPDKRRDLAGRASARRSGYGVDVAGRWALLASGDVGGKGSPVSCLTPSPPPPLPLRGRGDSSIPSPARAADEGMTERCPPPSPPGPLARSRALPLRGQGDSSRASSARDADEARTDRGGTPPPSPPFPLRGQGDSSPASTARAADEARTETMARLLLTRYGVVFRALLARESGLPAWRELAAVFRRLEARGEIRGGRFVSGFGGEQFALADAVGRLRAVRKLAPTGEFAALSGADPLNLAGILTPGARVPAIARNRILFRDGLAIAALEGGAVRRLAGSDLDEDTLRDLLVRGGAAAAGAPARRGATIRRTDSTQKKRIYAATLR